MERFYDLAIAQAESVLSTWQKERLSQTRVRAPRRAASGSAL
jgi:hypothetical protein